MNTYKVEEILPNGVIINREIVVGTKSKRRAPVKDKLYSFISKDVIRNYYDY